jgi:hypothetical protein
MTKIVVKSASPMADAFKQAVELLPAMIAYHKSQGFIYVADRSADAAASSLAEAGIAFEVVRLHGLDLLRQRRK